MRPRATNDDPTLEHLVAKRHARLFGTAPGQFQQFRASQGAQAQHMQA